MNPKREKLLSREFEQFCVRKVMSSMQENDKKALMISAGASSDQFSRFEAMGVSWEELYDLFQRYGPLVFDIVERIIRLFEKNKTT